MVVALKNCLFLWYELSVITCFFEGLCCQSWCNVSATSALESMMKTVHYYRSLFVFINTCILPCWIVHWLQCWICCFVPHVAQDYSIIILFFAAVDSVSSWIIAAGLLVQFVGMFVVVVVVSVQIHGTIVHCGKSENSLKSNTLLHSQPSCIGWQNLLSRPYFMNCYILFRFAFVFLFFFLIVAVWFSVLFFLFWRLIETAACSVWISFFCSF